MRRCATAARAGRGAGGRRDPHCLGLPVCQAELRKGVIRRGSGSKLGRGVCHRSWYWRGKHCGRHGHGNGHGHVLLLLLLLSVLLLRGVLPLQCRQAWGCCVGAAVGGRHLKEADLA